MALRLEQEVRLLYDDPRTYVILRDLAKLCATWISIPGAAPPAITDNLAEKFWWGMRHQIFAQKQHAMVGCVSIALSMLKDNSSVRTLDNTRLGKFVGKHIFLPVMLHHAYEWRTDIDKATKSFRESGAKSGTAKDTAWDNMFRPVTSAFGNGVTGPTWPQAIRFDRLPLVVLLAVADFAQEWGRPSGDRKPSWPTRIDGRVSFADAPVDSRLEVALSYDGAKGGSSAAKEDFDSRRTKAGWLRSIFDRGELNGLRIRITNDIHERWKEVDPVEAFTL